MFKGQQSCPYMICDLYKIDVSDCVCIGRMRKVRGVPNRPFPSSFVPLFQNESKCEAFHMKMSSACRTHFHANQCHFHKRGFALRLALKQRHKGTQKWPILIYITELPAIHSTQPSGFPTLHDVITYFSSAIP